MPPTDQHFRYLLAAVLQNNISLRKVFFVNPALEDERTKNEFEQRLFGPLGLFRREHLEQGIIELVPTGLREFLSESNQTNPEPYRVHIGRTLNKPTLQYEAAAPWRCVSHAGFGVSIFF
jgi:hypothetical protein